VVQLTRAGQIVEKCWNEIPLHYPHVTLDAYVAMPNHMHAVLVFAEPAPPVPPVAAGHVRPQRARPLHPLPTVVGSFKSAVSKQLGTPIWQRSYWDRIIRGDVELHQIRSYI
jgi:putative transposase